MTSAKDARPGSSDVENGPLPFFRQVGLMGQASKSSAKPTGDEHAQFVATAARRWFDSHPDALHAAERRVLRHAAARRVIARWPVHEADGLTFGQRLADRVAELGGSWRFILAFGASLCAWAALNSYALVMPFDPYPYIFLNLLLSMLAAIQAPVIMMSQNRQAAKDRETAALDYEVNLKAEIEIMALHDKIDRLRDDHIAALLRKQQDQISLLTQLISKNVGIDLPDEQVASDK